MESDDVVKTYLGAIPVHVKAESGATVTVNVTIHVERESDTLRIWAENIGKIRN